VDHIDTDTRVTLDRVVAMFRDAMPKERGGTIDELRAGFEAVLAQLPIPDDAEITASTVGGVDGYWVQAAGASNDRIGVMLHGGGFVMGSAKGYRAFAAEVSQSTKARVFVPEYRLAPEHPFPAGMQDARSVLAAAIDEAGPQSCFVIGDSAGGGLAVSAVSELHRTGAPLPACIVLVSALVDLTVSNPSFEQRASIDPICAQAGTRRNAAFYLGGQKPEDVPAAFPMLLDLSGFPPCLLLVGSAEVLRDDSRNLADKLEREGVHVVYHEYDDMIHVWPLFSSFLPQGMQALEEIGAYVGSRFDEATSR
jgi:monoterpene epsilon-lactone hydrolase